MKDKNLNSEIETYIWDVGFTSGGVGYERQESQFWDWNLPRRRLLENRTGGLWKTRISILRLKPCQNRMRWSLPCPMKDKNLNSEIETGRGMFIVFPPILTMKDKNLNSEIETRVLPPKDPSRPTPMKDKNLNSEIETRCLQDLDSQCRPLWKTRISILRLKQVIDRGIRAIELAMKDKNLNSEIETQLKEGTVVPFDSMKDKNLNSEIETPRGRYGVALQSRVLWKTRISILRLKPDGDCRGGSGRCRGYQ